MQFDSESKKKPYSPPTVKKLTLEQAKQFVAGHANCSDQEATDLLEPLRREQQQNLYFVRSMGSNSKWPTTKIVPHSREQARWVYNCRPFRNQEGDSGLCEVSPWRFWCWVEQATSAVMRRVLCSVPAMRSCFMTISLPGFAAWRKASNL